jgi:hypothetical protein
MHTSNKLKPFKVPPRKEKYPLERERQGSTADSTTIIPAIWTWHQGLPKTLAVILWELNRRHFFKLRQTNLWRLKVTAHAPSNHTQKIVVFFTPSTCAMRRNIYKYRWKKRENLHINKVIKKTHVLFYFEYFLIA